MRIGRIIFDRTEAGLSAFKQAGLLYEILAKDTPHRLQQRENERKDTRRAACAFFSAFSFPPLQ